MGDDQEADAELRHDRHRFRRHGGGVGASPERLPWERAEGPARLVQRLPALDIPVLQALQDERGILEEARAPLMLLEAKAFILDTCQPAADPQDEAPVGQVIEQNDLFGDTDRVMPGHDDDHGAELDALGLAGHVGEKLQDIGTHRVVGEMVFHRPQRVEAQRLCPLGQAQFVHVDVGIGQDVAGVLKEGGVAHVHARLLVRAALRAVIAPVGEGGGVLALASRRGHQLPPRAWLGRVPGTGGNPVHPSKKPPCVCTHHL